MTSIFALPRRIRGLLSLGLIPLVAASMGAQDPPDPSQVPVRVIPITAGVYMLEGLGGNIGLSVGKDDPFIIDDQYAPMTSKIKAAVATVTSKPIRFVVNTHWHALSRTPSASTSTTIPFARFTFGTPTPMATR